MNCEPITLRNLLMRARLQDQKVCATYNCRKGVFKRFYCKFNSCTDICACNDFFRESEFTTYALILTFQTDPSKTRIS